MEIINAGRVPIKSWAVELEAEAEQQVRNLSSLPFIHRHVALMPDAHAGKGSTVGTVVATRGAIIPSTVGVDIGCGMAAVNMPFDIDALGGSERLRELRHSIERAIPTGRHGNKDISSRVEHVGKDLWQSACQTHSTLGMQQMGKALLQVGTLGGGNHFIEICHDENNSCWIMLHSGSRNIGKVLAEKHIDRAKDLMKQYFISLPDPDLAYLAQGTEDFMSYMADLMWAQLYAQANRNEMMDRVIEQVYRHVGIWDSVKSTHDLFRVDCHHNYTSLEHHFGKNVFVTRKGAVSAKDGEYGIIPGSMGAKSFIVKGKGAPESFCSCSHGAGRRMSRTKARAAFTEADLVAQTSGVECRKDSDVIDEIPGAYKDIDKVMAAQEDLVTVVRTLKQVICVKGA